MIRMWSFFVYLIQISTSNSQVALILQSTLRFLIFMCGTCYKGLLTSLSFINVSLVLCVKHVKDALLNHTHTCHGFISYLHINILWGMVHLHIIIYNMIFMILLCRHKCSLWSRTSFNSLCSQRRRMGWTFIIITVRYPFFLHGYPPSILLGQSTWPRDLSRYWSGCLWHHRASNHFCKFTYLSCT